METRERLWLTVVLMVLGAGWGLTQPLSKIAVSEGYRHVGIIFWQMLIGGAVLGVLTFLRGRGLPMGWRHIRLYTLIAFLGTLLPNGISYEAARHLPSGWLSTMLAMVPIFAFPIALALGTDQFSWLRLSGLATGLVGVVVLAQPGQAPELTFWLIVGLISPALYAIEGNYVARFGTEGLDAVQVLFGASIVGTIVAAPVAILSGEWIDPRAPWGAPDFAILLTAVVHAVVYAIYVWLVGRAGATFAAQVSYMVTGFGVGWAILLLDESYTGAFWLALGLMLGGMALVQPRRGRAVSS